LFAAMRSLHCDGELARLGTNGTIALAVSALLTAFGPRAPRSFTIYGAWVHSTFLNLSVASTVGAVGTTMLGWLRDFEGSRLGATTTC
jgi:hypothetical protein